MACGPRARLIMTGTIICGIKEERATDEHLTVVNLDPRD
jgi:hypothetical protein